MCRWRSGGCKEAASHRDPDGFANLGSLGIMIGGLATLVPERRAEVVALGPKSIVAGLCRPPASRGAAAHGVSGMPIPRAAGACYARRPVQAWSGRMSDIERWAGDAGGRSRATAWRDLVFTVATAPGASVAEQTRASLRRISGNLAEAGSDHTRLQLLHKWGVGVDNLDLETARELGIRVARTTGSNSVAVAEFTIGLMVCALRHIPHGHFALQIVSGSASGLHHS